ncbi:MAG TPA: ABC transporter ATP-binding protein [Fibrobacteria bacterium]|nr:ABC transporter ATP-binding protein [Fibrobacteria bacterium]
MTAKESRIRLEGLAKKFGNVIAVYPTDIEVARGEFVVLLGPSGCGKTTTLRMIAGLEAPSQGRVFLDGKDATLQRPGDRDIAFVFQMFSLYPHLTVQENVAFTMLAQGMSSHESMRRSGDMLRHLGLGNLVHVRPGGLSGGDQQRVALARALVRSPRAFLMDEPLGTLDGSMREEMRETLRAIHNRSGATTVFVTHDQEEAMGLADRIAVMRDGRVVQFDHPRAIYDHPADLFVADFVGSPGMNVLSGRRQGEWVDVPAMGMRLRVAGDGETAGAPPAADGECRLGVRPENVLLSENGASCVVEHTQALGSHNMLSLRTEAGFLKAWIPAGIRFREGETVRAAFLPSGCRWFDGASGGALPWKTLEAACRPTR